jgi:hypothetical protein
LANFSSRQGQPCRRDSMTVAVLTLLMLAIAFGAEVGWIIRC